MELNFKRNRKGMLLTLVTIVLVVLMLGEVISYIYAGIAYNNIQILSNPASASSSLQATVQGSYGSMLHQSLRYAISALGAYESSNQIRQPVNSTSYALSSLMSNGVVYGANMISYMGNATTLGYSSLIHTEGLAQGLNASLTNGTIVVYQTTPLAINATYSGLLTINSGSGGLSYDIYANASLLLNGTQDVYGNLTGSPRTFLGTNPGNTFAIPNATTGSVAPAGSRSAFLSTAAPLYEFSSNVPCTTVVSTLGSNTVGRYIIAMPSANSVNSIICGAEGLVTYTANVAGPPGPPTKPFLTYQQSSCYIVCTLGPLALNGGPMVLLDGGAFGLFDFRNVSLAIVNGYYVPSGYSPSYLDLGQGSYRSSSPFGVAPFAALDRQVLELTGTSNMVVANIPISTANGAHTTISFWVRWPNANAIVTPIAFNNGNGIYIGYNSIGFGGGGKSIFGIGTTGAYVFSHSPYVHVVAVFDDGTVQTANNGIALYIDGVSQPLSYVGGGGAFNSMAVTNTIYIGGNSIGTYSEFQGQIANLQVYSNALSPYQIEQLYLNGINSQPVNYTLLAGWWPLNGNSNDYSGNGHNGKISGYGAGAGFQRLADYIGDSFDGGSFYKGTTASLVGLARCFNINNCNWSSSGIVYVPAQVTYASNGAWSSAGAESTFGLTNATVPDAAYFDGAQNASFNAYNVPFSCSSGCTISFWMFAEPQSAAETAVYLPTSNFGLQVSSTGTLAFVSSTGSVYGTTSNVLNAWVNVVAEFVSGSPPSQLYINGTAQTLGGSSFNTGGSNPSSITIGTWPNSPRTPFAGAIADVQVYNSALTASQALSLFQNNSVSNLPPTGSWPLSGGYDGFLNESQDLTGNSVAYLYKSGGALTGSSGTLTAAQVICYSSNETDAAGYQCGIMYLPHQIPTNYASGATYK